ncbi:hypothetical protein L227DRAFT_14567 [Lentinus tigrinus ALCF2SS1-6]|uniref:Uncharacterized protein n=1 Tax=Lentinus tigrinus ALCF2SS1-6 TaxID=1328759 RepID=A0A5C2SUH7_9APHY|nr:hypothetical protein L227DRAFT_14567 [Lentinus tigrinus ALCF2SS1-6]
MCACSRTPCCSSSHHCVSVLAACPREGDSARITPLLMRCNYSPGLAQGCRNVFTRDRPSVCKVKPQHGSKIVPRLKHGVEQARSAGGGRGLCKGGSDRARNRGTHFGPSARAVRGYCTQPDPSPLKPPSPSTSVLPSSTPPSYSPFPATPPPLRIVFGLFCAGITLHSHSTTQDSRYRHELHEAS